jgi:hypothetical protein
MASLPSPETTDSAKPVLDFFNAYQKEPISLASNDVDSVVGFFEKRGFEKSAAISVASTIITQAKTDNIKVFKILDTLRGLSSVQLSVVVTEILNYDRPKISSLGFKLKETIAELEARNIIY